MIIENCMFSEVCEEEGRNNFLNILMFLINVFVIKFILYCEVLYGIRLI